MIETIIVTLVGVLSSLLTWGATHTRRKSRAEAQSTEIENVDKVLKIYREIIEDLGKKRDQ